MVEPWHEVLFEEMLAYQTRSNWISWVCTRIAISLCKQKLFKPVPDRTAAFTLINCNQFPLFDVKLAVGFYLPFVMVVCTQCFAFCGGFFLSKLQYFCH